MDWHTVIPLSFEASLSGWYGGRYTQIQKTPSCLSGSLRHPNKGLNVSIKGPVLFRNQENLRLLRIVRVEGT